MDTSEARAITEVYQLGENVCRVVVPKGSILYSYGTPVAVKTRNGAYYGETYSQTTAKHITMYMPRAVKACSPPFAELLADMFTR